MADADCFKDPAWRLHNLYWITDKSGTIVKFAPNLDQQRFLEDLHYRNVILKARQRGFSTLIQLMMLDACVFNSNVRAGVIAHTMDDVSVIFRDKIKFAYDRLPEQIRERRPPQTDSATELLLSNNSSIRVGTSMRSGTLQYLHISEFGKICAKYPEKAREIITGAIPAVSPDGFLFVESTAEGKEGKFFEMCQESKSREGKKLLPLEEKFHFFPWFNAPEYEADPESVAITDEEHKYFNEIESKADVRLSMRKRAWYVITAKRMGEDMKREYPSLPEEAFEQSNEGAYYRQQMAAARAERRITFVPHQPGVVVNTFWDLGQNDMNAIWFHQRIGMENRFIRYYENSGESLDHYVVEMQKHGYVFGKHLLPHDATHKRLMAGMRNKSIQEMLEDLGLKNIVVVPRIDEVKTGIDLTRQAFASCFFDEANCKKGLEHLDSYSKEWNQQLGCWRDYPRHDIHSNGADAFRQYGQAGELLNMQDWGGSLNYPKLNNA
jgi:hypothetical protein